MTNQEKIDQFIQEHCPYCQNKNTDKCCIRIAENGQVRCSEEKMTK